MAHGLKPIAEAAPCGLKKFGNRIVDIIYPVSLVISYESKTPNVIETAAAETLCGIYQILASEKVHNPLAGLHIANH